MYTVMLSLTRSISTSQMYYSKLILWPSDKYQQLVLLIHLVLDQVSDQDFTEATFQ